MTLMLKAIGFRLDSIDYSGDDRNNLNENDNVIDSDGSHKHDSDTIYVNINCTKSKLMSRLSYKFNQDGGSATIPTHCTCPRKETVADNSFWEIQSSGSFINQQQRNKMKSVIINIYLFIGFHLITKSKKKKTIVLIT